MELNDKIIFPDDPEFPFRKYHDYYDKDDEDDDSAEAQSKSNKVTSTKVPKFPLTTSKDDGHDHGKLSTTAIIFIGISIAIIILIIIAALYFLWKSRRRASQASKGIKVIKTKGRGVTRPSFLPSHHEHNIAQQQQQVVPRKNESFHLDIPSPEWCNTSYPIITPYSFPSTSTVITPSPSTEPKENIDFSMSLVESYEKELANIEKSLNKKKDSTEIPIKPTRTKIGGGKLMQQKNLPNHRVTVL